MFNAGALTFREFAMREPLPLATIHNAVLEFLRGRDDAAVFGAQAVNAYVDAPRMAQGIDLLSTRAPELAAELRDHLNHKFHIAVRIREIGEGRGYRLSRLCTFFRGEPSLPIPPMAIGGWLKPNLRNAVQPQLIPPTAVGG
ncbi:MAG: hypothetical protein HY231_00240 [Acidobacteria bacterium]|nr:hypothetical protein [Acidobacteriota bacterium]